MIHLQTALAAEAKPLISALGLQYETPARCLFRHYRSDNTPISLCISGTGKVNAAAALTEAMQLYTVRYPSEPDTPPILVNIGCAGHGSAQQGAVFFASRIQDAGNGLCFYPQFVCKPTLALSTLVTLDKPSHHYCDELYDMEASAFYAIACRYSSAELCHCIKVVSDNSTATFHQVNATLVTKLLRSALEDILPCIDRLRKLQKVTTSVAFSGKFSGNFSGNFSGKFSDNYQQLTTKVHFTFNQHIQLQKLLARWQVLFPQQSLPEAIGTTNDSGKIIACLETNLQQRILNTSWLSGEE